MQAGYHPPSMPALRRLSPIVSINDPAHIAKLTAIKQAAIHLKQCRAGINHQYRAALVEIKTREIMKRAVLSINEMADRNAIIKGSGFQWVRCE